MKQITVAFFVFVLAVMMPCALQAYDFSAISPSGHRLYYNILTDSTVEVTYQVSSTMPYNDFDDPMGELIIPNVVTYANTTYNVTSIGEYAFYNCRELVSVTMQDGITVIEGDAFKDCNNLANIVFPATLIKINNNVSFLGGGTFRGCTALTSITLPNSIKYIGGYAFCNCSNIETITLPDTISYIASYAFANCSKLSTINIPYGITTIMGNTFSGCSNLQHIVIPSSITRIENYAFQSDNKAIIEVPSTVTYIHEGAFAGVLNIRYNGNYMNNYPWRARSVNGYVEGDLVYTDEGKTQIVTCGTAATSINIPNSVTTIGSNAFSWNDTIIIPASVRRIGTYALRCSYAFFEGEPPTLREGALDNAYSIMVPCDKLETYRNTADWPNDKTHAMFSYSVNTQSDNSGLGSTSIRQTPTCDNPQAVVVAQARYGYHFVRWSNGSTNNPDTLTVTSDTSLTAYFEEDFHGWNVSVYANNNEFGIVAGAGTYDNNVEAVLSAGAYEGYRFDHWNDGSTNNPRRIVVSSDLSFTAYFVADDDAPVHDTTYLHTHDTIRLSDTVFDTTIVTHTLHDTISFHDTIIQTQTVHDTVYAQGRDTAYITIHDTVNTIVTDTAFIPVHDTAYITIHDTVYAQGRDTSYITIHDTTFYPVHDTSYLTVHDTAYLTVHDTVCPEVSGIASTIASEINISVSGRQIVVNGAEGMPVTLYDMQGRSLALQQPVYGQPVRFDVPATGVYMVRIGNIKAQKVAVLR